MSTITVLTERLISLRNRNNSINLNDEEFNYLMDDNTMTDNLNLTTIEINDNIDEINKILTNLNDQMNHFDTTSKEIAREMIKKYNLLLNKIHHYAIDQKRLIISIIRSLKNNQPIYDLISKFDTDMISVFKKDIGDLITDINLKSNKLKISKEKVINLKTLLITSILGGVGSALAITTLGLALPIEAAIAAGVITFVGGGVILTQKIIKSLLLSKQIMRNGEDIENSFVRIKEHMEEIKNQLVECENNTIVFEITEKIEDAMKLLKSYDDLIKILEKQILIN